MNRAEQCAAMGLTAACGLLFNPWAAIGAFGGCCFFLAMPSAAPSMMQRILLSSFSWIMGYASGAFFYPGPPWSQEAMLVSGVVAALASVVFTGVYAAVHSGEDLPPWLKSAVELFRGRRNG